MNEYLGVWCPTCQQDSLPMRNGICGFCDTPLSQANHRPKETIVDQCKLDGCTNPPAGKGGPWKGMCTEHISAEMQRRHAKRRASAPVKHKANGTNGAPVVAVSLITSADRFRDLAERLQALRAETASVEQALKDAYSDLGQLV